MDKVVHFEIPTEDMARAKGFYEKTFGWKVDKVPNMDYTMAITGKVDENGRGAEMNSINGGMVDKGKTAPYPILTMLVDSVDESVKKAVANGGSVVIPVTPMGDFGRFARVKDTEGNIVGMWQEMKKM